MITINSRELRDLILDGITTEELGSMYDYSSIRDMSYMFSYCKSLESVPLFNTVNVTYMSYMFKNNTSLVTVPTFDTTNVVNMNGMFDNCVSLKYINAYNFKGYNFSTLDNDYLKEHYPELYV